MSDLVRIASPGMRLRRLSRKQGQGMALLLLTSDTFSGLRLSDLVPPALPGVSTRLRMQPGHGGPFQGTSDALNNGRTQPAAYGLRRRYVDPCFARKAVTRVCKPAVQDDFVGSQTRYEVPKASIYVFVLYRILTNGRIAPMTIYV